MEEAGVHGIHELIGVAYRRPAFFGLALMFKGINDFVVAGVGMSARDSERSLS